MSNEHPDMHGNWVDGPDDDEPIDRGDFRLTDLPIAAVIKRLEDAGDTEAVAVIHHLQWCIWDLTRSENSYGVPDSSWDCCGICEQEESGPGKFADGIMHLTTCPLHGSVMHVEKGENTRG